MTTRSGTGRVSRQGTSKKKSSMKNQLEEESSFVRPEAPKGLTDMEVENEHLKTTIVALNEKIEVTAPTIPLNTV